MSYDVVTGAFTATIDIQAVGAESEIYLPRFRFGMKPSICVLGGHHRFDADSQLLYVNGNAAGLLQISVMPVSAEVGTAAGNFAAID